MEDPNGHRRGTQTFVPLDDTDSCRDLHRARDQWLSAGRVL